MLSLQVLRNIDSFALTNCVSCAINVSNIQCSNQKLISWLQIKLLHRPFIKIYMLVRNVLARVRLQKERLFSLCLCLYKRIIISDNSMCRWSISIFLVFLIRSNLIALILLRDEVWEQSWFFIEIQGESLLQFLLVLLYGVRQLLSRITVAWCHRRLI